MKVSSELAQDRRAWSASVRDVVNAIVDVGSTRPCSMPAQVQVREFSKKLTEKPESKVSRHPLKKPNISTGDVWGLAVLCKGIQNPPSLVLCFHVLAGNPQKVDEAIHTKACMKLLLEITSLCIIK